MKILITGGTGFIGKTLCKELLEDNHELTVFSRKPDKVAALCGKAVQAIGNLRNLNQNETFNAVINLAGEGIADSRWTGKRKQILIASRIKTTEQLIDYIARAEKKPEVLISGSAVGFYGNKGDTELDEHSSSHDDFAHQLCAQWEAIAKQAESYGVRVGIIRIGLVIGKNGGFLARMLPPFKLSLGGQLGDGKQWMSWIHRTDLIGIIKLLLNSAELSGVFNATSPNPVTNDAFTRCLAKIINRPAMLPVPGFVLKLLLGEMSELLLGGQRVLPKRLQEEDYNFKFATLEKALQDIL